jgi:hypothetical protein
MKKDAAIVDVDNVADGDAIVVADGGGIKKKKKKWVPNLNVTIDLDDSTLLDNNEEEDEEKDESSVG